MTELSDKLSEKIDQLKIQAFREHEAAVQQREAKARRAIFNRGDPQIIDAYTTLIQQIGTYAADPLSKDLLQRIANASTEFVVTEEKAKKETEEIKAKEYIPYADAIKRWQEHDMVKSNEIGLSGYRSRLYRHAKSGGLEVKKSKSGIRTSEVEVNSLQKLIHYYDWPAQEETTEISKPAEPIAEQGKENISLRDAVAYWISKDQELGRPKAHNTTYYYRIKACARRNEIGVEKKRGEIVSVEKSSLDKAIESFRYSPQSQKIAKEYQAQRRIEEGDYLSPEGAVLLIKSKEEEMGFKTVSTDAYKARIRRAREAKKIETVKEGESFKFKKEDILQLVASPSSKKVTEVGEETPYKIYSKLRDQGVDKEVALSKLTGLNGRQKHGIALMYERHHRTN